MAIPRQAQPSRHDTLAQCWLNVGTPSAMLAEHWPTLGQCIVYSEKALRLCWVNTGSPSAILNQH